MRRIALLPESATKRFPKPSAAMLYGSKNAAAIPTPLVWPRPLPPARVVTVAVAMTILRMVFDNQNSETNRLPKLSAATPAGRRKDADDPMPFTTPMSLFMAPKENPLPARVVTFFVLRAIARIRPFATSATNKLPAARATPYGYENVAEVPTPFALPLVVPPTPPASVATARVAPLTVRIRWLPTSEMYASPTASTATPNGEENVAAVSGPSPAPTSVEPPPPASVRVAPGKQ